MPEWAQWNIDQFRELNPGYIVTVHTPDVLLDRYKPMAAQVERPDNLSDFWRYSALQRHGGWWFDVDYLPLRPVDDIVHAYGLDGSAFFVTEQHHQRKPHLLTAAGCLAATADSTVWALINERLEALPAGGGPLAGNIFGPALMTELVLQRPELFAVGRWPWFYPAGIDEAKRIYHRVRAGERIEELLAVPMRLTGEQLPFVMHLWAGGEQTIPNPEPPAKQAQHGGPADLTVGVISSNVQWKDRTLPFRSVADGLMALGCKVQTCVPADEWPLFSGKVDLLVIWNGRRQPQRMIDGIKADGVPVLYMELGFFDRHNYTQIDHRGFSHTASWANDWGLVLREGHAAKRLFWAWPRDLLPVVRRSGRVVVLGQVCGDTQMLESETDNSATLFDAVRQAVDGRTEVVYRPHPTARRQPVVDQSHCTTGTLAEDVASAAFVVSINSNAGHEALAMGCPVLCLGPALYAMAGVALQTTLANLRQAVDQMLDGWTPDPVSVFRYLYRLGERQWNQAELAKGRVLEPLIQEAIA